MLHCHQTRESGSRRPHRCHDYTQPCTHAASSGGEKKLELTPPAPKLLHYLLG